MKKLLIFLLAAFLLTGCGSEPAAPQTTAPTRETTLPEETTAPAEETTVPATQPQETTAPTEVTTVPTEAPTQGATEPAGTTHTHNYTATVIPATCTAPGTTAYFCDCGDNFTEGKTPPQGHSFGEWVVVIAPTETTQGLEERTCTECGEKEENYIN